MSRGEQDLEYKPKTKEVRPVRSSRRTRKVKPIDYSEAKVESDTEGEASSYSSLIVYSIDR